MLRFSGKPSYVNLDASRANFWTGLTSKEIRSLVKQERLSVLQTDAPVPTETWHRLNDEFFSHRPDVTLRVYHGVNDLSFLPVMRNVRRFSADCLRSAKNVEAVESLQLLQELDIGILELESFSFLYNVSPTLNRLGLHSTLSKKPSIGMISRFPNLRTLYLEGQQKGIEAISDLPALEDLTLRSISTPNLDYVKGLNKLWSIDIKLGGIRNLKALREMPQVKYLELWLVRQLTDLSPISEMTGLQRLLLQALRNVTALPDLSKLSRLRRIDLSEMKGLRDLSAIETAPALEEFLFTSASGWEPQQFRKLLEIPTLTSALVGFGSLRKNQAFEDLAASRGIASHLSTAFVYE